MERKTKLSMPASLRSSVPFPSHSQASQTRYTVLGSNDSLSDVYNAPKNVSARASVVEVGDHQFTAPRRVFLSLRGNSSRRFRKKDDVVRLFDP